MIASTVFLILVSFATHSNIFPNQFIGDDRNFILEWDSIKDPTNIPYLFLGDVPGQHEGTYRPVRGVFYVLVYQLSGTNPFGYHLFSILVHTSAVLSVFWLTSLISDDKRLPLITSLFFSTHPIHTEAVTFITASFDTPGIVFMFLSVSAFIKSTRSQHKFWYPISISFAVLGFFTNEISLALLPILSIYLWIYTNLSPNKIAIQLKPFLIASLAYLFIRFGLLDISTRGAFAGDSIFHSYLISIKALIHYIYLSIWPLKLGFVHQLPGGFLTYEYHDLSREIVIQQKLFEPTIIASIILIITLLNLAIYLRRHQKIISFAILWFFISLLPVLNLIPSAVSFSERYAYAASFGYCLFLGWLILSLPKLIPINSSPNLTSALVLVPTTIITVFYFHLTYTHNTFWLNSTVYWQQVVDRFPTHFAANLNLAQSYQLNQQPQAAIDQYQKVLDLKPNFATAYHRIGQINQYYGNLEDAITSYHTALQIDPNLGETKYLLSQTHYHLAEQLFTDYQISSAISHLQQASVLDPHNLKARNLFDQICLDYPAECQSALEQE